MKGYASRYVIGYNPMFRERCTCSSLNMLVQIGSKCVDAARALGLKLFDITEIVSFKLCKINSDLLECVESRFWVFSMLK